MRRIILAGLAGLILLGHANAQNPASPKTYTITVTADDASFIMNDLSHLPWKDVNVLLKKLMAQIAAQNEPSQAAAPKE